MKILYTRVSTFEQNNERQLNTVEYDYILSDKCSGTIPLYERPKGRELKKLIDNNTNIELYIHSIDRLGRNTIDVLNVWKELTEKGIKVICKNPSITNLDGNGKVDPFSQLLMGIMTSMADFERTLIRERQKEGIAIRKAKGLYSGRAVGSKDSEDKFLSKPKSKLIAEHLQKRKNSYKEIAKIIGCSTSTITKVKKTLDELNKPKEAV
jgi:DNA invertase Pin-like site-specific DNA recombinase